MSTAGVRHRPAGPARAARHRDRAAAARDRHRRERARGSKGLTWVEQASVVRMLPDGLLHPPDRAPAARAVAARRPLQPGRSRRRGHRGRVRPAAATGRAGVICACWSARARRCMPPGCSRCSRPSPRCRSGWSPRPGSASAAGASISTTGSRCCCPRTDPLGAWRLLAAQGARAVPARARDRRGRPALPARPDPPAARSARPRRAGARDRRDRPSAARRSRARSAITIRSACSTSAPPRCAA